MNQSCLSECRSCHRHVRCGERACPFCGAQVSSSLRVLEYRLHTRLDRSRAFSLGAALAAAGFLTNCEDGEGRAVYGAPCNPPSCMVPGGSAGQQTGGQSGTAGMGGDSTSHGGVSSGGEGGATEITEGGGWNRGEGGAAGHGGAIEITESGAWNRGEGGAAGHGGAIEITESGAWNRGEGGNH